MTTVAEEKMNHSFMSSRFILVIWSLSLCHLYSQSANIFQPILSPATADIKAAAEKGDAEAQYKLAQAFYSHFEWSNSVVWFRRAAKQGNAEAQYSLGKMPIGGSSRATKDIEEGVKWTKLAANQNHSMSQILLGQLYEEGKDLKRDYVEAFKWYTLVLNQSPIWRVYPDRLALKMTTNQVEEARKRAEQFRPTKSARVEPEFKLQGVMGSGENRLAMINGKSLKKGEVATVKIDEDVLKIRCLKIDDRTVLIEVEGHGTRTLNLGK